MLVCQREPVVSEERVGAVPESLDELVNHGNGLVVPSSMVGPADVDAQPRPVNGTVPRKGWETLLALTCVSEPVRALVPWCMDNIHAAESTCEATPLEFTLTLLELLLSSRKVDVPPQVVEVDMRDRSVVELAHGLRRQTCSLRSTIDWASPSICEDVDKLADLQEQGLCAHASPPLTTLLILEALHATEHLLQIIKDHTGHVELVVECHTCVRSLVVRVVALKVCPVR